MIESFGVSDPGCVRNNNEDCYLVAPALGLYLVADGMGGARAGEHASGSRSRPFAIRLKPPRLRSPDDLLPSPKPISA
jgi:serine/threonine protein phosphatase PrpC